MKRFAWVLALTLLAGCGGGGGNSSVPGSTQNTQAKTVKGSVVISIPTSGATGSAKVRYPQFVSPNASSVALSVNGAADQLFDVSSTSSICTTVSGSRNCTLSFGAPVGSDTFAFLIFSGPNGTGTQLASASATQTIASGQAFNFTVALNAAVGTIVASIPNSHGTSNCPNQPSTQVGVAEGCAGTGTLVVTVDDPSGAAITGTAPYATAIQIATNDPSLTASPPQITAPGQTSTLSYSGAPFGSGITNQFIATLTAGGQTAQATFPVSHSYLYVANSNAPIGSMPGGGGSVDVYAFGASGGAAPIRHLFGSNTQIMTPAKAISDLAGNLYVLDNGIPSGSNYDGNIFKFNAGTSGNVFPNGSIIGLGSLGTQPCTDMVFDPTQTYLFVACGTQINVFPISALIPTGSPASASPSQMEDDSAGSQTGLAFDQSGNLFIADDSANQIIEASAPLPVSGGYHPSIGGGPTVLAPQASPPPGSWNSSLSPQSLVVDNAGNLYAPLFFLSPSSGPADMVAELAIWNAGTYSCSFCAPSSTFTGAPFTTHAVTGVALDPAGNVYLSNLVTGAITELSRATVAGPSASSPAVLRTLTNTGNGQATSPIGIWVGP